MSFRLMNTNAKYVEEKAKEKEISRSKLADEMVETYRDMETICIWCEIEPRELARQIDKMFRDGEIVIKEGKIEVRV